MDQNIKNRLVGIAVISALAVIFLPMLLDGSGVEKAELEVTIPPQPVVEENPEFVVKQLELKQKTDAVPELQPRFVDEDSGANPIPLEKDSDAGETVAKKEEPPKQAEKPAEETKKAEKTGGASWVLQVGSFKDRNKALVQRDQLRKSNIAAVFIEQFNIGDQANFRVRLGPFVSRDQTQVAKNKILAKHGIDGLIMEYER